MLATGVPALYFPKYSQVSRVIAYYSKSFSPTERNYCVTRKELLAAILSIKHFRPLLYGRKFLLHTDHASILWLCRRSEPHDPVARWLEILSEYQYEVQHRPGLRHSNADGLSRARCVECKQCKRIEERDGGPTMAEGLQHSGLCSGEINPTMVSSATMATPVPISTQPPNPPNQTSKHHLVTP